MMSGNRDVPILILQFENNGLYCLLRCENEESDISGFFH
jgi:hypothetical protein